MKVLDFGLAKALAPASALGASAGQALSQAPTITTPAMTMAGMILGTAAYMSPEQAKGRTVDKRSDVWAFGAVLYEMLTGQRAFGGDDISDTLANVLKTEPDWNKLPADVSPRVRQVIRACIQKDSKRRIHDIADVSLALEGVFETAVSSTAETVERPHVSVWRRVLPSVAAAVVVGLVVGLAVWSLSRPAPPRVARFLIPLSADQAFNNPGRPLVAISPDGSHIVYSASGSLWLRPVDQLQAVQVPGTDAGSTEPFFSADGLWIGFWVDGQLQKVSVSGGAPVTLADVPYNPRAPSWGTDDMILYGQPDAIMQVPGASGTPALLIPVGADESIHRPQMLPGGRVGAVHVARNGPDVLGPGGHCRAVGDVRRARRADRRGTGRAVSVHRPSGVLPQQRAVRRPVRCRCSPGHRRADTARRWSQAVDLDCERGGTFQCVDHWLARLCPRLGRVAAVRSRWSGSAATVTKSGSRPRRDCMDIPGCPRRDASGGRHHRRG